MILLSLPAHVVGCKTLISHGSTKRGQARSASKCSRVNRSHELRLKRVPVDETNRTLSRKSRDEGKPAARRPRSAVFQRSSRSTISAELMQRLSDIQMVELSLEAMRSARRLLDNAQALARAQRLPSAFMVAGLAADELGKHILVTSFYVRAGTDDDWRKFWHRFRIHRQKLGDALMSA